MPHVYYNPVCHIRKLKLKPKRNQIIDQYAHIHSWFRFRNNRRTHFNSLWWCKSQKNRGTICTYSCRLVFRRQKENYIIAREVK